MGGGVPIGVRSAFADTIRPFFDTGFEILVCLPSQFGTYFVCIDRIAPVMSCPVGHKSDQCLVAWDTQVFCRGGYSSIKYGDDPVAANFLTEMVPYQFDTLCMGLFFVKPPYIVFTKDGF